METKLKINKKYKKLLERAVYSYGRAMGMPNDSIENLALLAVDDYRERLEERTSFNRAPYLILNQSYYATCLSDSPNHSLALKKGALEFQKCS